MSRTHGATNTPEFRAWISLRHRCESPKSPSFKDYGARGITVCERWSSFENFLADMGPRPSPDHSIDRRDNDKGYGPDNCRWATWAEQASNKRNNRVLTINGETRTLAQWARLAGLASSTLDNRLKDGWTLEEAVSAKPWAKGKQHSRARRVGAP
jgi:hypothetical protein